jgi:hypothetical protein
MTVGATRTCVDSESDGIVALAHATNIADAHGFLEAMAGIDTFVFPRAPRALRGQ